MQYLKPWVRFEGNNIWGGNQIGPESTDSMINLLLFNKFFTSFFMAKLVTCNVLI